MLKLQTLQSLIQLNLLEQIGGYGIAAIESGLVSLIECLVK